MADLSPKDFPVVVPFTLHWSEMDAFGHANNARTFTWFETARIAYLARIGMTGPSGAGETRIQGGIGPILKATQAEYVRPVVFPVRLAASARVSRIGNTSVTLEHAVFGEEDGTLYTKGTAVIVTLDYVKNEPVLVPASVRAAIEALEGRTFGP
ncbi:acyl-CoA thioester hydrolase [Myxococcus fulvus]|uniref:Acyl-CoA thioester hydrolase n=1 Tax=Myxococcus fulvus TaxID=33 RepID=A0A511T9D5_MYXFU|nr:thioesterase family protein [Myxococcus fulvus]GEN10790.1 thioesterase [Myxococcus fulvus]SEU37600.1 acyl-CoA thioester hydrolase [Myxococcus fulvus]